MHLWAGQCVECPHCDNTPGPGQQSCSVGDKTPRNRSHYPDRRGDSPSIMATRRHGVASRASSVAVDTSYSYNSSHQVVVIRYHQCTWPPWSGHQEQGDSAQHPSSSQAVVLRLWILHPHARDKASDKNTRGAHLHGRSHQELTMHYFPVKLDISDNWQNDQTVIFLSFVDLK